MITRHQFITALFAAGALFIGSSALARPTLQSLQNRVDNTYTKAEVDAILEGILPAAVPRTGQSTCYDTRGALIKCPGTGQDGDKLAGVAPPVPRFVDNGNGTVTDKLTGLIWLRNANCSTISPATWQTAVANASNLENGQCGLNDGSMAGQWRLPNVKELQSLINYGFFSPALSNAVGDHKWTEGNAFSGVQSSFYWSSSSSVGNPGGAWFVYLDDGNVGTFGKADPFTFHAFYVWPVRGGQ